MHRLRLLLVVLSILFLVGVAPAIAQEDFSDNPPAVVVEDTAEDVEEEAWTFRYLVPTLLGGSAIAILGITIGYTVRVRARYRVTQ